ncbi:lysylphosphatidylglycerol synthase transmembrane domain-containing protein [Candidatus Caldatribacterium saccharofermentans]|uniref:lysylphosphatidylglycerol synthase transmembrane domain-containing protein n=1 Tax=Candidatus Caldatribacterium saccharofermentans TaxID=1454753 RepID=UPI003CFEC3CF
MRGIEHTLNPRKILRQFLVGVGGSAGALVLIVLSLFRREGRVVFAVPAPQYLLLAVLLLICGWSCDALRVTVTARIWRKRIRFRDGLTVVLSGYFLSGITPANTGGNVAEIYVLTKSRLSLGEATSLTLVGGALYSLSLVVLFLLFSLLQKEPIPSRIFQITSYLLGLYAILIGILAAFLRFPAPLVALSGKVGTFLASRFPRLAPTGQEIPTLVSNFLLDLREKLLIFLRNPHYLGWNISMYCLHFLCLFGTTYFILLALAETRLSWPSTIHLQVPLFFALRFTPVPGASGVAELSFASLFKPFLEGGKVSLLVFFWRLLTYYGALGAGSIAFFRTLAR